MAYRVTYRGTGEYWVFGHRFAAGQTRVVESDAEAEYLRRQQAYGRPLFDVEPIPDPEPAPAPAEEAAVEAEVVIEEPNEADEAATAESELDEEPKRRRRGR